MAILVAFSSVNFHRCLFCMLATVSCFFVKRPRGMAPLSWIHCCIHRHQHADRVTCPHEAPKFGPVQANV